MILSQFYKNKEACFLNTVFYFPIDSCGVFDGFEAIYESKTVKGVIMEKEEAKMHYSKHVEQGETAVYGES